MIIGIDASRANTKERSGVEWYAFHLIHNLAKIDSKNQYFLYSTSLLATFIIFAHRSNIQRIIKGTENRFEKARIFHRSNDSD